MTLPSPLPGALSSFRIPRVPRSASLLASPVATVRGPAGAKARTFAFHDKGERCPLPRTHRHRRSIPQTRIGHVHLKVADLERAIGFYHGVLGFEIMQRWAAGRLPVGRRLSPPHRPQHLGEPRRLAPRPGTTGLFHTAILYPSRQRWPMRCGGWSPRGSRSTARPITASAKPCTSATPTRTASSSTATARRNSGQGRPKESWPCIPGRWI